MKRALIAATCLLAACGNRSSGGSTQAPPTSGKASPPGAPLSAAPAKPTPGTQLSSAKVKQEKPQGEDILASVRAMNSDKYARPPIKFRRGHVRPNRPPKVKRTKSGFEVRFPSRASITTPAVYQGKVYVSGGFRSKDYYALHATTGKPAWSVRLDDDGPSTAACSENICVFNTESCTVFAVDGRTGKHIWSYWLGDPLTSSPTIANGIVFTSYPTGRVRRRDKRKAQLKRPPGASHVLIAIDLKSGKILWQKWLDSDVMSAPVASGKFVYVTTFRGSVMKLEQATGKFRYAIRARATSAPVVQFNQGLESMYYTRRAAKVREKKGAREMIIRADHNHPKTKFKTNDKSSPYLDPSVQEKSGYAKKGKADDAANGFGGGAPASANPDAAKGTIGRSSVSTMQAFQGSRILHLGKLNINTMGDEVIATSAEDGKTMWTHKLKGNIKHAGGFLGTAPLAAGNSILFATLAGQVIRMDPATGKVRARYKVGGKIRSQPVAMNGWIYVGTQDGRLIAINTGDKSLTGWPMWGGNAARTGISKSARN